MSELRKKQVEGFQRHFLVVTLILLLVTLVIFANPFIIDLLIAAILVVAVNPVHKRILNNIKFSRSVASFVSMLFLIVVVLLPFTLFAVFLAQEAGGAYRAVSSSINEMVVEENIKTPLQFISAIPLVGRIEGIFEYLPFSIQDVLRTVGESVGQVSTFLIGQTTNILKHLSIFLIHIIVFLMSVFYFLRDGDRLVAYLKAIVPLNNGYRDELFEKLANLSYGIIYGIFGAAILQGFLVGIGFAFAGFSNAAFWGVVAALFSPVPYIGTMVVWLPAVIILAVGSKWLAALLLAIWCMAIVSTADNVVKPYLIGASSALNPMALLVVILGGAFAFGLKGLIYGPFILTLSLSFLHIYQLEYRTALEEIPETPPKKRKSVKKLMARLRSKF